MDSLDIYLIEEYAHKISALTQIEMFELKEAIKTDHGAGLDELSDQIHDSDTVLKLMNAIVDMGDNEIEKLTEELKQLAESNLIDLANERLECIDPEEYAEECRQERALSDHQLCSDIEV